MKIINAFTDGSFIINNGLKFGGIGIYFEDGSKMSKAWCSNKTTNQRMELRACIKAIDKFIEQYNGDFTLNVYSDSSYVVNSMNLWMDKWKMKNWRHKKNLDLIKRLYKLKKICNVKCFHVKSHQSEPPIDNIDKWNIWYGNKQADLLATQAVKKLIINYNINGIQ